MRRLYLAAGVLSVTLGAIGAILPIVPTVPFLLLAAFCFARSNEEWERKIIEHPRWGPQIMAWRERRAIARNAKISAIAALAAGVAFTYFTLGLPWVWISIGALVIIGTWIAMRAE
ncbi:YbaN family protein [uncultured Erythrobacter sp.]|uniref:YbaN family protein n=1 Tax=uncultured Erythrobacter sp. TaxID=263913 RepID=UPI0026041EED|nr:YbaN family protein [uncultured Erythrobacter sp.]